MRRILVIVVLLACFGTWPVRAQEKDIRAMADKLSEGVAQAGKKTVAVVDFSDLEGCVTELGRFFAEEFSASLAEQGKGFQVIDRTSLRVILQENKLASTGIIDPTTARKLGQIAGVESLVTATLTPFGDSIRVAVKVLDATNARILTSVRGDIARTKTIDELLSRSIAAGCSSPAAPADSSFEERPPAEQYVAVESDNVRTEARECRIQSTRVVCRGTLTYLGEGSKRMTMVAGDRAPTFGSITGALAGDPEAFLIDNRGGRFQRIDAWFGGLTGTRDRSLTLPSGIPMNAVWIYEGCTPGATAVNLVMPGGAVLRNVPLK